MSLDLVYPCPALGFPCWKVYFLKLMISCCSFLFDLTQLWGSHCKAFQEIIDNSVEAVALIALWFLNQISINVLLNPIISSLPSLQVIPYLVFLKNKEEHTWLLFTTKVPIYNSPQHKSTMCHFTDTLKTAFPRGFPSSRGGFCPLILPSSLRRVRSWLQGLLTPVWCQQFAVPEQDPYLCTDCSPASFLGQNLGVGLTSGCFLGSALSHILAVCSVALDSLLLNDKNKSVPSRHGGIHILELC